MSRRRLLAICFVSVFRCGHALLPFTRAGSFSPLQKPSLLHTLAGVLVVIITASKDAYFLPRNPIFSGKQPFSAFPKKKTISSHSRGKRRHFGAGQKKYHPRVVHVLREAQVYDSFRPLGSHFQSFSLYIAVAVAFTASLNYYCLLYTSPSPRD